MLPQVLDSLRRGHQVMVFVHSRKDTVKTGRALAEATGKATLSLCYVSLFRGSAALLLWTCFCRHGHDRPRSGRGGHLVILFH